jgi:hypothetical protein
MGTHGIILFCNVAWQCNSLQYVQRLHNRGTRQRSNQLVLMELQISALQPVGRIPLVARDSLGNVLFVKFNEVNFINRWVKYCSWTATGWSFLFKRNNRIHEGSRKVTRLLTLFVNIFCSSPQFRFRQINWYIPTKFSYIRVASNSSNSGTGTVGSNTSRGIDVSPNISALSFNCWSFRVARVQIVVFCLVAPCIHVHPYQCFGEHLQGRHWKWWQHDSH